MTPPGRARRKTGRPSFETLYGIHPVFEALRAGRRAFHEIVLSEKGGSERLEAIAALGASLGVPVRREAANLLAARCGSEHHQGAVLRAGPYPYLSAEALMAAAADRSGGDPFFLFLDSVQDPHNLGAILRTALCAGVDGVVVTGGRTAPASAAVAKVSAGALEHVRLYRVGNLADTLLRLREGSPVWVVGLERDASRCLYEADLRGSLGMVVGGEDRGIRRLVAERCDDRVFIPQEGPVTSLNASVAAGIGIYEAVRQRRRPPDGDGRRGG